MLPVLQACYTYAPVQTTTPPVGETVLLQISDRGRVGLGERLGPGVAHIEGRVTQTNGDEYAINVFQVAYINGERSMWSGELVRLDRDFVAQLQERKLSKSRTWIAAGAATVAVTAFMASRGLLGFWTGDPEQPTTEPPVSLRFGFGFHF